jgi:hypothetical protein
MVVGLDGEMPTKFKPEIGGSNVKQCHSERSEEPRNRILQGVSGSEVLRFAQDDKLGEMRTGENAAAQNVGYKSIVLTIWRFHGCDGRIWMASTMT